MGEIDREKLIEEFVRHGGKKEDILSFINKGNKNNIGDFLSREQANEINRIIKDKEKTKEILSSPQAKQLLKLIMKNGGNNG